MPAKLTDNIAFEKATNIVFREDGTVWCATASEDFAPSDRDKIDELFHKADAADYAS